MASFLEDFRTLSQFGATPGGGVERQAATPADAETREWLRSWLTQNGFRVELDPIGNLFGLLEFVPGAPWIVTGSHLDSQPLAGRFDGAYGVLASAHAARAVRDSVASGAFRPAFNLAVVDWFNEEGSRFTPSMMGSAVYTGTLALETALETTDEGGTSVADALNAMNGAGDFEGVSIAGYAEIHIEQGRVLEESSATIGLVADTWMARKLTITVRGEQAHTGAARMADRRDALYGAARIIVAARDLVSGFDVELLHTAVSELHLDPNSPVAIAREVRLLVDVRSPQRETLETAVSRLYDELTVIGHEARVDIEVTRVVEWFSGPFWQDGLAIVAAEAERHGLRAVRLSTVAGHDATNVKEIAPTILVFVPSVDGLSHNEREYTSDADLLAGLQVLEGVIARLCVGEFADDAP